MRVGFACNQIGPWTFRGAPSRKAGHRQVETPPEKMDRAALAQKRGAELLKDLVYLRQDAPEAVSVDGVVGGMDLIFITVNGIANFAGQGVDGDLDAQGLQAGHKLLVKSGDRPGDQWERFAGSIAGENEEVVFDEVKIDGKGAPLIGNGRRCQPTRGDIQRDMPPMVHRRTRLHSDLANDLCPQM